MCNLNAIYKRLYRHVFIKKYNKIGFVHACLDRPNNGKRMPRYAQSIKSVLMLSSIHFFAGTGQATTHRCEVILHAVEK